MGEDLMIKNDWILDMVESFGKSMGKTVLNVKEDPEPIVFDNLSDKDILLIVLRKLISEKKFNEAEDTLFKFVENNNNNEVLKVGEWFYGELSSKSDNELLENNFIRDEIKQGLRDFKKYFG